MPHLSRILVPPLLLLLAACGSTPDGPPGELLTARDALGSAPAGEIRPYAETELLRAQLLLDEAEAAWRDGREESAARLAQQAEAALHLAQAKADAGMAAAERDAVASSIDRLEREVGLGRAGSGGGL